MPRAAAGDPFRESGPEAEGRRSCAWCSTSACPIRPPGLKGVLITEAQIAGVVTSPEPSMNVVIIAAPGAKAPYFARVGDELYDATVKSIKLDAITFALTAPGGGDQKPARDIVRKVRPMPGEDK